MRQRFGARFSESNLHATLLQRIVLGNTVIDHERISRTFAEGAGTLEVVMIYELLDGRIARAWTIPGSRTLDAPPA